MAINIYSLEKSELELKDSFLEFFALCQKMYFKAQNEIGADEISQEIIEKFLSYKLRSNEKKRDIRDDCTWIISKDQPRAGHLRFIIAVLYSIKDLERIIEQAYNVVYYSKKYNLPLPLRKLLMQLFQLINSTLTRMYEILQGENVGKYELEVNQMFENFKVKYKSISTNLFQHYFSEIANKTEVIYNFSIVMKYTDRTMDHIYAIYNNFDSITNVQ